MERDLMEESLKETKPISANPGQQDGILLFARLVPCPGSPMMAQHNKALQSDQTTRYARGLAAERGR